MTQQPAYTTSDVIAAGMAMRARGAEPDRPGLWNELGRRGLSKTAWNTWLEHRDQQLPPRPGIELGGETQSPELTAAIEGHNRTLATVIACARAEAEAPLRRRIEALERCWPGKAPSGRISMASSTIWKRSFLREMLRSPIYRPAPGNHA